LTKAVSLPHSQLDPDAMLRVLSAPLRRKGSRANAQPFRAGLGSARWGQLHLSTAPVEQDNTFRGLCNLRMKPYRNVVRSPPSASLHLRDDLTSGGEEIRAT